MKTYFIWLRLLMKRMVKKPAFLLFLLIMPLLSFVIDRLGQGESAGAAVGIYMDGQDTEEMKEGGIRDVEEAKETTSGEMNLEREFLSLLYEQKGILQFRLYESEEEMRQDVEKGGLDCGVSLQEELWEGLETGAWQDTVIVYVTSSSSMTEVVKERIASLLFTLYSENNYVNYIEQAEAFAGTDGKDTKADIVSFAKAAYETHLLDGSTFDFQYHGNEDGNKEESSADKDGSYVSGEGRKETATRDATPSSFRLRGILAVCIFLSGLSGLLTDWKDREEKRFFRIAPPMVTTMVNIWIPTVYMSAAVLFSLWLTGNITVFGPEGNWAAELLAGFGKETAGLVFYQFLIVIYCSIIRIVLRKQETIAAAIPLLTLCSMVCCPVWIRLAAYVPLFNVLEKLFPVTYYLLL